MLAYHEQYLSRIFFHYTTNKKKNFSGWILGFLHIFILHLLLNMLLLFIKPTYFSWLIHQMLAKCRISHSASFIVGWLALQRDIYKNHIILEMDRGEYRQSTEKQSAKQAALIDRTNPITLIKNPFVELEFWMNYEFEIKINKKLEYFR